MPCVGLANTTAARRAMPVVTNDDDAAGALVADHLLAAGHRHFAVFSGLLWRPYFHVRIRAFARTLARAGYAVKHGPPWPTLPPFGTKFETPPAGAWHAARPSGSPGCPSRSGCSR